MKIEPVAVFTIGIFFALASAVLFLLITSEIVISSRRTRLSSKKYERVRLTPESDNPYQISNLLRMLSHQWLSNIRFQQSYSSGWGGELGLPAGISISAEQAIEFSENQISLPEIVDGYRKYMEQVTKKYDVIIGIDEMDKMDSGENARQFLNEIKSVFGISRCFYLISVSENAMSSFERRGLPFRDEFDSAFDDVVYVDYLKYATALKLLRQRVLAIPPKFSSFCFAMSGGLPRDLIRICREIIHMAKGIEGNVPFKKVFIPVIEMDLFDKVRAAAVSATRISSEPGVSKFLSSLHKLERNISVPETWKKAYLTLSTPPESKNGTTEANDQIVKLYFEFSAYLYYMITLYEYFSLLDNPAIPDREFLVEKYIDWLAETKQALADSPYLAISLLDEWRTALKLTPITQ